VAELFVPLVAILIIAAGVGLVASVLQARQGRRAAAEARARQAAKWAVGDEGAPGKTLVFIRKVTADGQELERRPIAEILDEAPDWDAQLLEARTKAANRAALLNTPL
jgi:hypothetical protein